MPPLTALRLRWGVYLLLSMAALIALAAVLTAPISPVYALRYLLQSTLWMLIQAAGVWRILPRNHRPGERELLPRFGPGNSLTLARGTLIAALGGFLLLPRPTGPLAWLPFALYLLADLTDFLDGYFARRSDTVTALGETLDMNHDALGVLVVTALAFQYGSVPWWYAPFGLARYLFLLGLYIHRRRGGEVLPLHPSDTRRWFAGLQMGFITAMLAPALGPPATTFAATLFLLPFSAQFLLDYLQVTGKIEGLPLPDDMARRLTADLPLMMRALSAAIYAAGLLESLGFHPFGRFLVPGGLPASAPPGMDVLLPGLRLVFLLALVGGVFGRLTPIAALLTLGLRLNGMPLTTGDRLLIAALTYLLFTGMGKYAPHAPIEYLIHNRLGKRRA
ncbi:MAG: CDP-alcohol phosphatidyltransferase family protein [Anaerolineae bacterium]|nr:MAG: CDP-alcohol phosphatidyltransferase family protein [Anaerolineae bacterium]